MFKVYCASAMFKVAFTKCLGLGLYVLKHHQSISTGENVMIIIIILFYMVFEFE